MIARALRPIDAAWLAALRLSFGLALAVSMLRFLAYGWVERFFVEPSFHFKYWGFEWLEPLSAGGMHALFVALTGLALAVALGFAHRLAAPLLALGLAYFQLLDVSTYLNHYYLAALLTFLLALAPASRVWSIDAWLAARYRRFRDARAGASTARTGSAHGDTVASAWLWLFRFQIGIVYTFAGLAKAQPDWLIHAQPLRIWLGASSSLPVLGPLLTTSFAPLVLSWCGFLFDSSIVWFLLFRRTRPFAYAAVVVFHLLTRVLFPIGMFPVIMILSALVFFEPSWPRVALAWLLRPFARLRTASRSSSVSPTSPAFLRRPAGVSARLGLGAGALYCLVQLAMPLRWLAYDGNVLWHEQGMRFSWRVMVRAKGGSTTFVVRHEPSGRTFHVSPRTYLTGLQESEMSSQPDLILQLSQRIADDFAARGLAPVSIRAETRVSLNGRRGVPLIDPTIDLGMVRDDLAPASWIRPAPPSPPPHTRAAL